MRPIYVLLLAVCIAIASCDAVSAFATEQEGATAQRAAAEYRGTSGKRLLRSDNTANADDDVDEEERRFGVSKLTEVVKKGKTKLIDKQVLLQTKLKDKQLLRNYQQLLKGGFSDEAITGAWLTRGKSLDDIFDRWIRLGKSERQAANNLLKQNKTPDDLYSVFAQRGMNSEQIQTLWRSLKLDEDKLIALQKKFVLVN
ncbi:hypothetical protein F442_10522 [Phytophthora nicotianae P10297]|uniref:RxLR effector protein n=2 Tax=Phytophthora nicotianae TaxID=4792 RepID=W2Z8N3_PHYNI|nr:hypothetical protein F442_10522 [Phytophthora nicotianae P10297]